MTIFALSSAQGRAGVAIIRLSGPACDNTLLALGVTSLPPPRHAAYCQFLHPQTKQLIDKGLAIRFPSPKSFTGEDCLELHIHGGNAVMTEMLETLGAIEGLRMAEPGEFSRIAFANHKMDLTEAEGLADLIDAETPEQKKLALEQLQGGLSKRYTQWRSTALTHLARMEALIDFPEEDIPQDVLDDALTKLNILCKEIETHLDDHHIGERIRSGIRIAIIGPPNSGKSSLLNYLAGRDAAIVSHHAGTTRDVVEVAMNIGGYAVMLADTAGIRETEDVIEQEGIRRSHFQAQQADLCLQLYDAVMEPEPELLHPGKTLLLANKIDQLAKGADNTPTLTNKTLPISLTEQINLDAFEARLIDMIQERFASGKDVLLTRQRHRDALLQAAGALRRLSADHELALLCEDIRQAAVYIGSITGHISVDEVLDRIFSEFCIGK